MKITEESTPIDLSGDQTLSAPIAERESCTFTQTTIEEGVKNFEDVENKTLRENEQVYNENGNKLFTCSTCYEKFSDSSDLKKHEMIHTDCEQFSCSNCDKKFNNLGNMKMHKLRKHSNEKPSKCALCDMKFKLSGTECR